MTDLTIFTCPKAFVGRAALGQRNALANWRALGPKTEIWLLGDDPGVAEAAAEFGCRHWPDVARNASGTPLVSDLFRRARELASAPLLSYINADILVPPQLPSAVLAAAARWPAFLLAGRRWNADLEEELDFSGGWPAGLETLRRQRGTLFSPDAIDYFAFPKGLFADMPPFAVGRFAWDNWIVRRAVSGGLPVIDATEYAPVIHQNHGYEHIPAARPAANQPGNAECDANRALFQKYYPEPDLPAGTLAAAAWRMDGSGRIRPNRTFGRLGRYARYRAQQASPAVKDRIARWFGDRFLRLAIRLKRRLLRQTPPD